MANIIKTVMTYPLNGSTRDFNIPFEYLARKFIQVTLIGRDRKPLSNIDDYRFTSKNQITTNKAWGAGDGYELIELRRFTSATERLVDFSDGSILRAYDLNVSQIQTLHVAEEARDLTADTIGVNNEGHLDARGRRIVNLADPVNELDAVNLKTIKEWNNGAYQSFLKAQEEANKAARSAAAAKVSETNAYSHMTQAGISEQRSKASETSAENSKNAAAASAQSASQSAASASKSAQEATGAKEYTKQQADRSYNEAERAKGYADSMGNAIDIGKAIERIDPATQDVYWKSTQYSAKSVVARGLNFQVRPTSKPGFAIEMGVNQGSATAHYAWKKNDSSNWNIMYYPEENGATFATREFVNKYVGETEGGGSQLQRAGSTNSIAVNSNGNCGIWDAQYKRWLLRVNTLYAMEFAKDLYMKNGDPSASSTKIELVSPSGDRRVGLWAYDDGRTYLSAYAGGSWSNLTIGGVGNGVIATREWVNANVSSKVNRYRVVGASNCVESNSWGGEFGGRFNVDLNGRPFIYTDGSGSWYCSGIQCGSVVLRAISDSARSNTTVLRVEGQWLKANNKDWRPRVGGDRVELIEFY